MHGLGSPLVGGGSLFALEKNFALSYVAGREALEALGANLHDDYFQCIVVSNKFGKGAKGFHNNYTIDFAIL